MSKPLDYFGDREKNKILRKILTKWSICCNIIYAADKDYDLMKYV